MTDMELIDLAWSSRPQWDWQRAPTAFFRAYRPMNAADVVMTEGDDTPRAVGSPPIVRFDATSHVMPHAGKARHVRFVITGSINDAKKVVLEEYL